MVLRGSQLCPVGVLYKMEVSNRGLMGIDFDLTFASISTTFAFRACLVLRCAVHLHSFSPNDSLYTDTDDSSNDIAR